MKKITLLFLIMLSSLAYCQETEYNVKKILSPQYGKIPSGSTKIFLSDKLIKIKNKAQEVEYIVDTIEDSDFSKTYLSKKGAQNEIRFTYYKNEKYIKFENKDNFSGKVGELQYYLE